MEDGYIAQAYNGSIRLKYRLPTIEEGYNGKMRKMNEPFWGTKGNKIPKDLSRIEKIATGCNRNISYAIVVLAVLISIVQMWLVISDKRYCIKLRITFTLGCFAFNIGAIVHALGRDLFPYIECQLRPLAAVVGLTLIGCGNLALSIRYAKIAPIPSVNTGRTTNAGITSRKSIAETPSQRQPKRKNSIASSISRRSMDLPRLPNTTNQLASKAVEISATIIIGLYGMVILIVWIGRFPMTIHQKSSSIYFSESLDQYARNEWRQCWSDTSIYFIAICIISKCLLFISIIFTNYRTMKLQHGRHILEHFKNYRKSVVKQFINFATLILISLASSTLDTCIQSVMFTFFLLFFSAVCQVALFNPLSRRP